MKHSLETLTDRLLNAARKAGADEADAIALQGTALAVDIHGGKLELAERSEGTDLGLRVFIGQRQAIVSSSDVSGDAIDAMAERAIAMAKVAPEDPFSGLASSADLVGEIEVAPLELADPTPEPSPSALQNDALEAEAAAQSVDKITQVEAASATYSARDIQMAATNGFSGGYRLTSRSVSCVAIAGEGLGMERDHDGDSRTFQSDLRSPTDIGRVAAERTVERLSPRKPPTGSYPVLFDERVSSSLIGHLLAAANGSAVARGASWLLDKCGEPVLPKGLDLIEDPHRPRARGTRPFDAEGIATQKRKVVEDGVLTGWTLDLATARKLEMSTTGNAGRGTSSSPYPTNWNVALTQGNASREDLLRDMGTGLLVTSMIGSTINPNTGDYSRGAAGFWVENGEIAYPVSECTIAGSLPEMLQGFVPADDARTWLSRVVPSLLIEGMTLAGA